jgi:hypothetical protein
MPKVPLFPPLLAVVLYAGCGGGSLPPPIPPTSALHGGILVPLPEDRGYVELVNGQRTSRSRTVITTIVAYLMQSDQKTALTSTPSSVSVKLLTPKGQKEVPLKHTPEPGDPAGTARFVSEPGPLELNGAGGEITVVLDGKTLIVPFRGPR